MNNIEALLSRLLVHDFEFVVVGGFAAIAHGATTVTFDIDVCCRMTVENLMRLQACLAGLHPVHRMTPGRQPLKLTPGQCGKIKNLYLDTELGQLDCLGEVTGVGDFESVLKESVEIRLEAGPCRILNLEALIRAKEAMHRPKDLPAILQLKAIKQHRETKG